MRYFETVILDSLEKNFLSNGRKKPWLPTNNERMLSQIDALNENLKAQEAKRLLAGKKVYERIEDVGETSDVGLCIECESSAALVNKSNYRMAFCQECS